jgi:gliding motility-associated-like protein
LVGIVDTVLCSNGDDGSITVSAEGGVSPYAFNWGEFGSGATVNNLEAETQYAVVITDANGCEMMLSNIEVEECIQADCFVGSEVLTPNGDAYNEYFKIACADDVDGDLHVYDRWGKEVYFQQSYDNTWFGLDNDGNELIEGGYMWVLSVNSIDGRNYYKGSVTILRDSY